MDKISAHKSTNLQDIPDHALSETVKIARDLIRFDTTNRGGGNANPERPAADYIAAYLQGLGIDSQIYESAPGRANLIAHIAGADPSLPGLVLHGHLDVVPADPHNWSVDPFAGVIKDSMLWGRGAVDMKDMCAMMLTAVAHLQRTNTKPRRNLILAFFADEENGSDYGSTYMVENHPEVFAKAAWAVSEVGGFSAYFDDKRAYLLQTGEKSLDWVRVRARGIAEHGSKVAKDNPLVTLSKALTRLGEKNWPTQLVATTRAMVEKIRELTGQSTAVSADELVAKSGTAAAFLNPTLRATANPTVIQAGYMHNVIPDTAEAIIDIRALPGEQQRTLEAVKTILGPDIELEIITTGIGLEAPTNGELVEAVTQALRKHDPEAVILPYLMSGGTDNKQLSKLGIRGYGFAPLKLPKEMDFPAMFHGVDERVPLASLDFGHKVLIDLLRSF